MTGRPKGAWKARQTLLIVGEGDDEEAFLRHVKKLYISRGGGLTVTIRNARGKGAKHVIEWTKRQAATAAYDTVAVLMDTDTDWSQAIAARARKSKIQVLTSNPCFEAMMLRFLGETPRGDSRAMKKQFAPFVNQDATELSHYGAHFGAERLEADRLRESTIDALLKLMGK